MTTLELNARKADMIRAILNDMNSEIVVDELDRIIRRFTASPPSPPCLYTEKEIKESAVKAIAQRKDGRYTSHDAMERLFDNMPLQ